MDDDLKKTVAALASKAGITQVDQSFYGRLDQYMVRSDVAAKPERDRRVVEAYLCSRAIRIAKAEGKSRLEREDIKASIWYFHIPTDEIDPCVKAAEKILEIEKRPLVETERTRRGLIITAASEFTLEAELRVWLRGDQSSGRSGSTGMQAS